MAQAAATRDLTATWLVVDMDAFFASVEELHNPALVLLRPSMSDAGSNAGLFWDDCCNTHRIQMLAGRVGIWILDEDCNEGMQCTVQSACKRTAQISIRVGMCAARIVVHEIS